MSKTFRKTCVTPSIRSPLSLAPFVFSTELARGEGAAVVMLVFYSDSHSSCILLLNLDGKVTQFQGINQPYYDFNTTLVARLIVYLFSLISTKNIIVLWYSVIIISFIV